MTEKQKIGLAGRGLNFLTILFGAASAIAVCGVLLIYVDRPVDSQRMRHDVNAEFSSCSQKIMNDLHPKNVTDVTEANIANICNGILINSYSIADFDVRREAFIEQYQEQKSILWLVLSITVSGIALTALQLASSYNLTILAGQKFEAGGRLDIEERKLSIQSSVSGLLILCLSFGFFLVYLVWVYPISTTDNVSPPAQKRILLLGASNAAAAEDFVANRPPVPMGFANETGPTPYVPAGRLFTAPTLPALGGAGRPSSPQPNAMNNPQGR